MYHEWRREIFQTQGDKFQIWLYAHRQLFFHCQYVNIAKLTICAWDSLKIRGLTKPPQSLTNLGGGLDSPRPLHSETKETQPKYKFTKFTYAQIVTKTTNDVDILKSLYSILIPGTLKELLNIRFALTRP